MLPTAEQLAELNDILEMNVDKRSAIYKSLKDKVEWIECKMPKNVNFGVVFEIYRVALGSKISKFYKS